VYHSASNSREFLACKFGVDILCKFGVKRQSNMKKILVPDFSVTRWIQYTPILLFLFGENNFFQFTKTYKKNEKASLGCKEVVKKKQKNLKL
jgi:hypothetical protein